MEDGLSTTGSDSRWSASASGFPSLQSRLSNTLSLPGTNPASSALLPPLPYSANPPSSLTTMGASHHNHNGGGSVVGFSDQPSSLNSNYSNESGPGAECLNSTIRVRGGMRGGLSEGWCRWSNASLPVAQFPSIGVSRSVCLLFTIILIFIIQMICLVHPMRPLQNYTVRTTMLLFFEEESCREKNDCTIGHTLQFIDLKVSQKSD